jgi:hypothetical protein
MFRVLNRKSMMVVAAAAVLGATAPMLADGPWFGVRLGGPDRDRWQTRRPQARPPVVVHPPRAPHSPHSHRPVEEAPCELTMTAYQAGDTVILIARGTNRAAGFVTSLLACASHAGTPEVTLSNSAPAHCGAEVHTAFEVSGSFRSHRAIHTLDVHVAGVCHHVHVCQVGRMS